MKHWKIICLGTVILASQAYAQLPAFLPAIAPEEEEAYRAKVKLELQAQPTLPELWNIAARLPSVSAVDAATLGETKSLIENAQVLQTAGKSGETRRRLIHAATILLGQSWNANTEFTSSLTLHLDAIVADRSVPILARLEQTYPASSPGNHLALRIRVARAAGVARSAEASQSLEVGEDIRTLWTAAIPSQDLIDSPFAFDIPLDGLPEGTYAVVAEVLSSGQLLKQVASFVTVVDNLGERGRRNEQELAKISGHEASKATIRFPFELARALNGWRREQPDIDVPAAIKASEQLTHLIAVSADPLYQSTGEKERHYWFAAAGEMMPYRIYVPRSWNPRATWPVVVVLHGGGENQDSLFNDSSGHGKGLLARLAEQHHSIVVSPLGFRSSGGYGAVYGPNLVGRAGVWPGSSALSAADLSERDVLEVLRATISEYHVDRSRIYLFGNSMGGGGVWHIGADHPELFAALAPCATSMRLDNFPFQRIAEIPLITAVGANDVQTRKDVAAFGVAELRRRGDEAFLIDVPRGTHDTAWLNAAPQIFDFFALHQKSRE